MNSSSNIIVKCKSSNDPSELFSKIIELETENFRLLQMKSANINYSDLFIRLQNLENENNLLKNENRPIVDGDIIINNDDNNNYNDKSIDKIIDDKILETINDNVDKISICTDIQEVYSSTDEILNKLTNNTIVKKNLKRPIVSNSLPHETAIHWPFSNDRTAGNSSSELVSNISQQLLQTAKSAHVTGSSNSPSSTQNTDGSLAEEKISLSNHMRGSLLSVLRESDSGKFNSTISPSVSRGTSFSEKRRTTSFDKETTRRLSSPVEYSGPLVDDKSNLIISKSRQNSDDFGDSDVMDSNNNIQKDDLNYCMEFVMVEADWKRINSDVSKFDTSSSNVLPSAVSWNYPSSKDSNSQGIFYNVNESINEFCFPFGVPIEIVSSSSAPFLSGPAYDKFHIMQFSPDPSRADIIYACCLTVTTSQSIPALNNNQNHPVVNMFYSIAKKLHAAKIIKRCYRNYVRAKSDARLTALEDLVLSSNASVESLDSLNDRSMSVDKFGKKSGKIHSKEQGFMSRVFGRNKSISTPTSSSHGLKSIPESPQFSNNIHDIEEGKSAVKLKKIYNERGEKLQKVAAAMLKAKQAGLNSVNSSTYAQSEALLAEFGVYNGKNEPSADIPEVVVLRHNDDKLVGSSNIHINISQSNKQDEELNMENNSKNNLVTEEINERKLITQKVYCMISTQPLHSLMYRALTAIANKERNIENDMIWDNYECNSFDNDDEADCEEDEDEDEKIKDDNKIRSISSLTSKVIYINELELSNVNNNNNNNNNINDEICNLRVLFLNEIQKTLAATIIGTANNTFITDTNTFISVPGYVDRFLPSPSVPITMSDWTSAILFSCFNSRIIIKIINLLLMEKSLIILGKNPGLVTACTVAISSLMNPFSWTGVFIPLVPSCAREVFEAPVPFIFGTTFLPCSIDKISPNAAVISLNDPRGDLRNKDTRWKRSSKKNKESSDEVEAWFMKLPEMGVDMPSSEALHIHINSVRNTLTLAKRARRKFQEASIQTALDKIELNQTVVIPDKTAVMMNDLCFLEYMTKCEVNTVRNLSAAIKQHNSHFCGDINDLRAWKSYVRFDPKTGDDEFYPSWFMRPIHSQVEFQEQLVKTQLFVTYIDRLRREYSVCDPERYLMKLII
jgi:hypothetical protein